MQVFVDLAAIVRVKSPEVNQFAGRVNFGLVASLRLVEHGACVDFRSVFATKQFAGFEEYRCTGFPRHGRPHVVGIE